MILDQAAREAARSGFFTMHWFQKFSALRGFPDDYLTLDVETTGVRPEADLICTYGYTVVQNRQPVETREIWLDWTRSPIVSQEWLQLALGKVEMALTSRGRPFHHSYAALAQWGVEPAAALHELHQLLTQQAQANRTLVMHNGVRFDAPMIRHNLARVGVDWEPPWHVIYDTGAIEKAAQLPAEIQSLPAADESMSDWARRILEVRIRGVLWALDGYCNEKYRLFERAKLSETTAHTAGADSLLLHHLFEAQREASAALFGESA